MLVDDLMISRRGDCKGIEPKTQKQMLTPGYVMGPGSNQESTYNTPTTETIYMLVRIETTCKIRTRTLSLSLVQAELVNAKLQTVHLGLQAITKRVKDTTYHIYKRREIRPLTKSKTSAYPTRVTRPKTKNIQVYLG